MADSAVFGDGWITVVNRALALIAKKDMDSMDDMSDPMLSAQVQIALPEAVEYVLSSHPWNSMTKTITLSPVDGKDDPLGNHLFLLPGDYLAMNRTGEADDGSFVRTKDGLRSPLPSLTICYVAYPSDPGVVPHTILNCISAYLAFLIANSLVGDATAIQIAQTQYTLAYNVALRVDASERRDRPYVADWTEER